MALTVALQAFGHGFHFNPLDIDASFKLEPGDLPDGTGYDISEDAEDGEEVDQNSDREKEKDDSPGVEEKEQLLDNGSDPYEARMYVELNRNVEWEQTGDIYDGKKSGTDVSEVFGLREYREGDTLQSIHWKLSGKMHQLIVREFGRPVNYHR